MKLVANSETAGNATIPIRWCLAPEEIAALRYEKVADPYLLLITVHKKKDVDRQLVPLDQMMTYLSFNHPGENTVFATVVWHDTKAELKKWCLDGDKYGNWETLFYDQETDSLVKGDLGKTRMTVNVSSQFFAKEPPAWEKWWTNLWFEREPRDQCQYRRRRMVAYSIQPPLVLLFITIITMFRALAAAFWFVFRTRTKINFEAVVRPFKFESNDVWYHARYGRNFYKENKDGKERPEVVWFFHPTSILLVACLLLGIDKLWVHFFSGWWLYLLLSPVAIGVVIVTVSIVVAFVTFISSLAVKLFKRLNWRQVDEAKRAEKLRKKREKQAREDAVRSIAIETKMKSLEGSFPLLTCDGPLVPKIEALPREKQTVHLRFLDLKSKVCKPFAG